MRARTMLALAFVAIAFLSAAQAQVSFDRDASRYHAGVYQRKRADLMAKMNSDLSPLFMGQLANLHKVIIRDFKAAVAAGLKHDGYDFAALISESRSAALNRFKKGADGAPLLLFPSLSLKMISDSIARDGLGAF